jgi:hypothetical protein
MEDGCRKTGRQDEPAMSDAKKMTFDESLPSFTNAVRRLFDNDVLRKGVVLRDSSGRLSFIADLNEPTEVDRKRVLEGLAHSVGGYGRTDRIIAFRNDPGASRLLKDPLRIPVYSDGFSYQLIDRRIVGAAWLETPAEESVAPPRIVFASLKGGVGRSTALAIAAADLARRNRNVLVVDLDLEAPGLGDLLLGEDRRPPLGTVDFLVENGISNIEDPELESFVGISGLTTSEGGRVDVVPSFGRRAIEYPENVLPKLARAMIDDLAEEGESISVTAQIAAMITRLSQRRQYDVVLIDSRAGLTELVAPAILGLGATVLLFGTAQRQTFEGYRALFAALRLLAQRDKIAGKEASWRTMFKAVHAKATLDPTALARHRDELYELFAEYLYDLEEDAITSTDALSYSIDDPSSPHWPLIIPFNPSFADFDSAKNPNQLNQSFYEQTFRQFMDGVDTIISDSASLAETKTL